MFGINDVNIGKRDVNMILVVYMIIVSVICNVNLRVKIIVSSKD